MKRSEKTPKRTRSTKGDPIMTDAPKTPRPLPTVSWGHERCGSAQQAEAMEWLVTNGLGGYASGTVAGMHTRRYHGLLVAAQAPPLGRRVLLSRFDDEVHYLDKHQALYSNRWRGGVVTPEGHLSVARFALEGNTPVWTYAIDDALLEKRIFMVYGENTTVVVYRLVEASAPLTLHAKALVTARSHHHLRTGDADSLHVEAMDDGVRVTAEHHDTSFVVVSRGAQTHVHAGHDVYRGLELRIEAARGFDHHDDLRHAATFTSTLHKGDSVALVCSTTQDPPTDIAAAQAASQARQEGLLERASAVQGVEAPLWVQRLTLAADQFIARRTFDDEDAEDRVGATIMAGYPWFGDWGRDTMISLPGLTLSTGRPEVAARILRTFAGYIQGGLLPNRFPSAEEPPEYNTVDATLWYFEAIRATDAALQTHGAPSDDALIETLAPFLTDILEHHLRGTLHGIGVDPEDGLLRAGEEGVQLTWMDARVEKRVITPRMGKPVEINALWINALRFMADVCRRVGGDAARWTAAAQRAEASFSRFWSEADGHLMDVIDGPDGDDASLRPNQLVALALPHCPLPAEQQRAVLTACGRHLLAGPALRSLTPTHPDYVSRYEGGPHQRDASYHQGIAWGWLLGLYAFAHARVHRDPEAVARLLSPLAHHLDEQGLGSVAEIFDAAAPFTPRGCIAQAWSVAVALQAWTHSLKG